jgi:hypothetical protein
MGEKEQQATMLWHILYSFKGIVQSD